MNKLIIAILLVASTRVFAEGQDRFTICEKYSRAAETTMRARQKGVRMVSHARSIPTIQPGTYLSP
jgi:hypothetical protein